MAISVGADATDRASSTSLTDYTRIFLDTACTGNGTLSKIEIFPTGNCTDLKVGTFHGSKSTWTCRGSATLGNATGGSKNTFTGLSISASTGDYLGAIATTGSLDYVSGGAGGLVYKLGDQFDGLQDVDYTVDTMPYTMSLYGDDSGGGATVFLPNIMKHNFIPPMIGGY